MAISEIRPMTRSRITVMNDLVFGSDQPRRVRHFLNRSPPVIPGSRIE